MAKVKGDMEFDAVFAVTPRGLSKWCKWDVPSDYGKFAVDLYLNNTDTEKFTEALETMRDNAYDQVVDAGKRVSGKADVFKTDDEGNVFFTFKVDAAKVEKGKITIVDKYGKVDDTFDKKIGNGSTIKVKYMAKPYYMQSTKQVGVSLRLLAIQVIDLVEYQGVVEFEDESGDSAPSPFEGGVDEIPF